MLFITLLTCWTQLRIMCTVLFPCKIRFILVVIECNCDPSDRVNWNLFARLSITFHQHPSSYNIRMFWCKCIWCPCPFSPWRMTWIQESHSHPWESLPP